MRHPNVHSCTSIEYVNKSLIDPMAMWMGEVKIKTSRFSVLSDIPRRVCSRSWYINWWYWYVKNSVYRKIGGAYGTKLTAKIEIEYDSKPPFDFMIGGGDDTLDVYFDKEHIVSIFDWLEPTNEVHRLAFGKFFKELSSVRSREFSQKELLKINEFSRKEKENNNKLEIFKVASAISKSGVIFKSPEELRDFARKLSFLRDMPDNLVGGDDDRIQSMIDLATELTTNNKKEDET